MLRKLLLTTGLAAVVAASAATQGGGLGTPYCFGVNCPCGNDDSSAGCANSSGRGAALVATGSTSVASNAIAYTATHLATSAVSLLVVSTNQRNIPFGDGRLCVGPGMVRNRTHLNSGQGGTVTFTNVIGTLAAYGCVIEAGQTWHAQVWFRDTAHQGVCGSRVNLTNAYSVTFTQ